ncbi:ABC transporter type 1, transmembrane domain-containing protein [Suillus lakei]|nr:ABC transporter type 1, transmembrane domain-containing protein [Suillus lakei]KAG1725984.1 ABC transporter type 1, transmembrane domain-containing protein [Suillus lakei]
MPGMREPNKVSGAAFSGKFNLNLPQTTLHEVAVDPSWRELFACMFRLTLHLWPSHYPELQFTDLFPAPCSWTHDITPFPAFGGLAAIHDAIWIPLMQYSDRSMTLLSFNHVLTLSLSWHTKRKTGELLRILDRRSSVDRVGELIGFTVILALVDVRITLVVFVVRFELALGAVVGVVTGSYIWASVVLTRYRTRIRRQMNERDVVTRGIHMDCLPNYEIVKYFGGEECEAQSYMEAIGEHQSSERRAAHECFHLIPLQNHVNVNAYHTRSISQPPSRITRGQNNTSDFVVFITYYAQLYFPLLNLGGVYRAINQSLIDTEKLLYLYASSIEGYSRDLVF